MTLYKGLAKLVMGFLGYDKPAPTLNKAAPTPLPKPSAFFAALKPRLFKSLKQSQVDGINAILRATSGWPLADVAYALATAYHETGYTMQPIKERGGRAYFTKMYDKNGRRPHVARVLGNTQPGDGAKFAGRGYVQLTGRKNYARATKALQKEFPGLDLVSNPDDAMRPDVAAAIMVRGMREGWFTTRALDDDLPRSGRATLRQYQLSRDIINGTDKALKIAREADLFEDALVAGGLR